jgi:hypothetical protein
MAADWYTHHLEGHIPVFYISEDIIWREKATDIGIASMSLKGNTIKIVFFYVLILYTDYLDKYHADNSTVLGLFDSLSLLLSQKEENEGSVDVPTQFEDVSKKNIKL